MPERERLWVHPKKRTELSAFLRARRAELSPEAVGLQRGPRRLTPGLRREEVASLACIGATWYTWLEQGRNIQASPAVLDRIAKDLRLSTSDRAYLFALAMGQMTSAAPVSGALGLFRSNYASRVGDPSFEELVRDLRHASPEFVQMWEARHTEPLAPEPFEFLSDRLGRLSVHSTRFCIPTHPGFLMLVLVPANEATAHNFAMAAGRVPGRPSTPRPSRGRRIVRADNTR
jgi:transcriptional regulator with XRE-family HTH domain